MTTSLQEILTQEKRKQMLNQNFAQKNRGCMKTKQEKLQIIRDALVSLNGYARHDDECVCLAITPEVQKCDCGYRQAVFAFQDAQKMLNLLMNEK